MIGEALRGQRDEFVVATRFGGGEVARTPGPGGSRRYIVAVAGLVAQPAVASVICGATSGDQVRANAAALRWRPSREDLVELDELTGGRS